MGMWEPGVPIDATQHKCLRAEVSGKVSKTKLVVYKTDYF